MPLTYGYGYYGYGSYGYHGSYGQGSAAPRRGVLQPTRGLLQSTRGLLQSTHGHAPRHHPARYGYGYGTYGYYGYGAYGGYGCALGRIIRSALCVLACKSTVTIALAAAQSDKLRRATSKSNPAVFMGCRYH